MPAPSGPSLLPAQNREPTSAAIFLHGYGSNGDDLIGLAPFFARGLPATAFYSPHAPQPWEGGFFGGRQWFSLAGYDPEALRRDPARAGGMLQRMLEGAQAAARFLDDYIDAVVAHHQLASDKVALIGFSQGTMMALYAGLRREQALAGIVGFSGAMLGGDALKNDVKSRPPVLLVHGDADPVVPVESLGAIKTALTAAQVPFDAHVIAGLQHGIDDKGATLAAMFLQKHLTKS
ncbi:MAG: dienelactone hydrolase family protein [Rhodospirillaceae bacterium]|nr:dienelactone hydrolase family protein [Rhodospirillaceae bacterium]